VLAGALVEPGPLKVALRAEKGGQRTYKLEVEPKWRFSESF